MRNLLLSLSFACLISTAYGQKCESKPDPITGEKVISFINKHKTLRFENKGTELTDFYTTFNYIGEQNVIIEKGSEVTFKLKNGKVLELESIHDTPPKSLVYAGQIVSTYTFAFQLTKQELETLASDKIEFMRYPSPNGGTLDYDVKGLGKIFPAKITKGAECLVSQLN